MINVIVDISHWNAVVSFPQAYRRGLRGVLHKATQGTSFVDDTYAARRTHADAAHLWWGAYHFGEGGDVAAQVAHFLGTAQPEPDTLLALDWEPAGDTTSTMTRAEAEEFVQRVADATGRFPGLYSGQSFLHDQMAGHEDSLLVQCWLWIARYSSARPEVPPPWPTWTLWQYTDGTDGPPPYVIAGIGRCDRDRFNGDMQGLRRLWGVDAAPIPKSPAATIV